MKLDGDIFDMLPKRTVPKSIHLLVVTYQFIFTMSVFYSTVSITPTKSKNFVFYYNKKLCKFITYLIVMFLFCCRDLTSNNITEIIEHSFSRFTQLEEL